MIFMATLLFTIFALNGIAAQPPAPGAERFGVEDASGASGTLIEVPVYILNVSKGPVQGIRFRIEYSESILTLNSISWGNLTARWTHLQLGEDRHTAILGTSNLSDALANGSSGSVATLNFSVIGTQDEMTALTMTLIELANPAGIVGSAPAQNGTFTVTPSSQPTPTPTPGGGGGGGGGGGYYYTPPVSTPPATIVPPTVTPVSTPLATTASPPVTSETAPPGGSPFATATPAPTPSPAPGQPTPSAFSSESWRWVPIVIIIVPIVILIAGFFVLLLILRKRRRD